MNIENKIFGNQNIEKRKKSGGEKNDSEGFKVPKLTRRRFGALASAVVVGLYSPALRNILFGDKRGEREGIAPSGDELLTKDLSESEEGVEENKEETAEQQVIEEEDIKSITEFLDYNKEGEIEINAEMMEQVKKYWKKRYTDKEDPRLNKSLIDAHRRMGEWNPLLEDIFKKENVPEEFARLAIPESHWQLKARSTAGAVGPYQFTARTAQAFGLKVGKFTGADKFDERIDPLKSGQACARLLKSLYRASGDWDLALSGYNGGFIWRFIKEAKNNKVEISYPNFLTYLESKINNIRDEIKNNDSMEYRIRKGDNLKKIAAKFRVSFNTLCAANSIQNQNFIKEGDKLTIPIKEKKVKEKTYYAKISGFVQNLNYPAKFNAINELIKEGEVTEQKEPLKFKVVKTASAPRQTYGSYKVKPSEGLYRVSVNTGVSMEEIKKANPGVVEDKLSINQILKIPKKITRPETLRSIAEKYRVKMNRLIKLNPAITDSALPLPDGYSIRI